jgi:hypothetical protein
MAWYIRISFNLQMNLIDMQFSFDKEALHKHTFITMSDYI